jgi:hypothetical protein
MCRPDRLKPDDVEERAPPDRQVRQLLTSAANYLAAASYLLNGSGAQHPDQLPTLERADLLIGEALNILALVKRSRMFSRDIGRHVSLRAVIEKASCWLISPDGAPVKLHSQITQNAAFAACDEAALVEALSATIRTACEALDGQRERKISIATERTAREVRISVSYRGRALADMLDGNTAGTAEAPASASVRALVEAQGGRIQAEYLADGRVTIHLLLPPTA